MYMIHEHSKYTSAIDKYWLFEDKDIGYLEYKEMISAYSVNSLNKELYEECYDMSDDVDIMTFEQYLVNCVINQDNILYLEDYDYNIFVEFDKSGFGRRP